MSNVKDIKSKPIMIEMSDGVARELKLTLNALAELEDMYGSVDEAFKAAERNSVKAVRAIIWAGMTHLEGDEALTLQQVGKLIDVANLASTTAALQRAMEEQAQGEPVEFEQTTLEEANLDPNDSLPK